MKPFKFLISFLIVFLMVTSVSTAGDFGWMDDFNIKAEADPSGFKARLSTRFKIGNAEINAILGNVDNSADAYMVLRLGEMSGQPTEEVIKRYNADKGGGWGALAKKLGIKPGSPEFHALKRSDDVYGPKVKIKSQGPDKDKGKSKK